MKLGVKTYDSESFLKHFENLADFFEIQAIQKNNYDFLKNFSKPIVIHAEHDSFGINPADKNLYKKNLESINFAINLANKTNARKIIVHPGNMDNKNCSKEQAIHFIKSLKDKRIIIENLSDCSNSLCTGSEGIKEFMNTTDSGFCLDISHCIVSSNQLGLDYKKMIKKFIKLKPNHYHISGQNTNSKTDNHYSFSDKNSNIPIKEILKLFPKDAEITLEVTTDVEKTKEDLRKIRKIIEEL